MEKKEKTAEGTHLIDPRTPEGAAELTEALQKLALSGDHTPTPTEEWREYKGDLFKDFRSGSDFTQEEA